MALVTYLVTNMRVTKPKGKTAERNPERVFTVTGTFYSTELDPKGNIVPKDKLSIPSKNVDREDIVEGWALDPVNGILTLPEGKRGRRASEGLTAEEIAAELAALAAEPEAEPEAEAAN